MEKRNLKNVEKLAIKNDRAYYLPQTLACFRLVRTT